MFENETNDLEPKRKFSSSDSAQLVFSALVLINSAVVLHHQYGTPDCDHYKVWNWILLIGSLIWLVYLFLTLIIQFRNKGMVLLLATMDWIFILFHMTMFVWGCVLFFHYSNTCGKQWDYWVLIYLIFGFIASAAIFCVLFMGMFRKMNKNAYIKSNPDHDKVHHPEDYVVDELADGNDYGDFY